MSRSTPPRPVDLVRIFPELRDHAATATRLHPRPGAPTTADSSIGGPVLWPADEPWPVCTDGDTHYVDRLETPASVRRGRQIYAAARARAAATGNRYDLTDAERAELPAADFSEPHHLVNQPIPLVPVAQLHRRDVPDFAGPDDTDLLTVLWCPLDHEEYGYNPRPELYWRRAADVTDPLAAAPEPPVVNDAYLPEPCTVFPEQVREYPYHALLPEELAARITAWEEETGHDYRSDLSLAPGWKVGGFAEWSLTDPLPMTCTACGSEMTLLLTAATSEWHGQGGTWRPTQEPEKAPASPTEITIGRGYALYIFRCPTAFDHPPATAMQ